MRSDEGCEVKPSANDVKGGSGFKGVGRSEARRGTGQGSGPLGAGTQRFNVLHLHPCPAFRGNCFDRNGFQTPPQTKCMCKMKHALLGPLPTARGGGGGGHGLRLSGRSGAARRAGSGLVWRGAGVPPGVGCGCALRLPRDEQL